jgi:drug/metabolite transporter (DMT)-like permease
MGKTKKKPIIDKLAYAAALCYSIGLACIIVYAILEPPISNFSLEDFSILLVSLGIPLLMFTQASKNLNKGWAKAINIAAFLAFSASISLCFIASYLAAWTFAFTAPPLLIIYICSLFDTDALKNGFNYKGKIGP